MRINSEIYSLQRSLQISSIYVFFYKCFIFMILTTPFTTIYSILLLGIAKIIILVYGPWILLPCTVCDVLNGYSDGGDGGAGVGAHSLGGRAARRSRAPACGERARAGRGGGAGGRVRLLVHVPPLAAVAAHTDRRQATPRAPPRRRLRRRPHLLRDAFRHRFANRFDCSAHASN